jgi:hypothetical protein
MNTSNLYSFTLMVSPSEVTISHGVPSALAWLIVSVPPAKRTHSSMLSLRLSHLNGASTLRKARVTEKGRGRVTARTIAAMAVGVEPAQVQHVGFAHHLLDGVGHGTFLQTVTATDTEA